MSGHLSTALAAACVALLFAGCTSADMQAGIYDPSRATTSYGYNTAGAGSSAWSGYGGVAPTVPAPPPTASAVAATATTMPVSAANRASEAARFHASPIPPMRLAAPGTHAWRSTGWHHRR